MLWDRLKCHLKYYYFIISKKSTRVPKNHINTVRLFIRRYFIEKMVNITS